MADEGLERVLNASELSAAMRHLRPEHRDAIVQLFYVQRSVSEAADVLNIPAGTVKSRAFYGLRELRTILNDRGVQP
jgi:RNA polymerase sigma-70 factor (ECF subfamily)